MAAITQKVKRKKKQPYSKVALFEGGNVND